MPILEKIVIQNWRNIELQELVFSPKINCISGNNGEGKTNLLDAVYYLSMTRSAFGSTDQYNYRHGCDSFALAGTYLLHGDKRATFSIKSSAGEEKKVLRDGKPYQRFSEHIGVLPIVMVSPGDTSLVSESSDERRKFFNAVLSQMDSGFLGDLQRYQKLLNNRNTILKSQDCDRGVISTIDMMMDNYAQRIYERREAFVAELEPVVKDFYSKLSPGGETIGLSYRSDLKKDRLGALLEASFEKDRVLGFTTVGIHRDDFLFTMNGFPIRKTGSQGQQKSFLVSLKFAQYELMKKSYGFPPIMLLDDLFDKLDTSRTSNLLKMVAGEDFGQIFLSDTDRTRLSSIIGDLTGESTYYETKGGVFTLQ